MDYSFLSKISYGVYIVSSFNKEKRLNGQISNTVFQVTSDPPRLSICINKQNLTHQYLEEVGLFSVSVLSVETPMTFIGRFGFKSGRDINKFDGVDFFNTDLNLPVVRENSIAWIEAKIISKLDVGTHTLFVGDVLSGEVLGSAEPMTYDYYHKIKGGKSPKTAPTFILSDQKK